MSQELEKKLHGAIKSGDVKVMRQFLDTGLVDANYKFEGSYNKGFSSGVSLLIAAVDKKQKEMVMLLLERGADPELITGFYGHSAASFAKKNSSSNIQDLLARVNEFRISGGIVSPWVKLSNNEVAHISFHQDDSSKVSRIFNFYARDLVIKDENLKNNSRAIASPVSFDTVDIELLKDAVEAFEAAGGKLDKNRVFKGRMICKDSVPKL